ncbi:MAG: hypothetical protein QXP36_00230 [Conexivisphaerales archaeon]
MNKSWKNLERKIAKIRNTTRTPLSGINSKITGSDIIDEKFFVECKLRKSSSIWHLYDKTKQNAVKEKKVPIVVVKQKHKKGELYVIHSDFLDDFIKYWKK